MKDVAHKSANDRDHVAFLRIIATSRLQVIHQKLDAALTAVNITSEQGTLNRQAKAAAYSAFESNKQRFFNHLITAMAVPTLIRAMEADLAAGKARSCSLSRPPRR